MVWIDCQVMRRITSVQALTKMPTEAFADVEHY